MKTRLDPVLGLREKEEEAAAIALAAAAAKVQEALEALERAQLDARRNALESGSAADWDLRELAQERALARLEQARADHAAAVEAMEEARRALELAHQRTEAVRRVAEARRAEARAEADRKERKEMDELGTRSWITKKGG